MKTARGVKPREVQDPGTTRDRGPAMVQGFENKYLFVSILKSEQVCINFFFLIL